MNTNISSKSGLFLMELMISILFFSLAGAICIQMFVHAHLLNNTSRDLNHSVEWCQNISEVFYGCNGNEEEMVSLLNCYHSVSEEGTMYILFFDKNFQPITFSLDNSVPAKFVPDYSYFITIDLSTQDDMLLCHVQSYKRTSDTSLDSDLHSEDFIYELHNTLYLKESVNYEN